MTCYLHSSRRRVLTTVGSSVLTAGIAGCLSGEANSDDSDRDHNHDHDETGPVSRAEVAMLTDEDGHRFEPYVVWIETGGTVTWTNRSGSHTTTAYHSEFDQPVRIPADADPWDSGMFTEEGESFEREFEIDGVYDYFCVPHDYRAMVGTVIVGNPDPHEQPGLEEPQDELPARAQELLAKLNDRAAEKLDHTHDYRSEAMTRDYIPTTTTRSGEPR